MKDTGQVPGLDLQQLCFPEGKIYQGHYWAVSLLIPILLSQPISLKKHFSDAAEKADHLVYSLALFILKAYSEKRI